MKDVRNSDERVELAAKWISSIRCWNNIGTIWYIFKKNMRYISSTHTDRGFKASSMQKQNYRRHTMHAQVGGGAFLSGVLFVAFGRTKRLVRNKT